MSRSCMRLATLRWNSMARLNAKNNAETVLAQAVSESDTEFIVEDAGALPDVPFRLSIEDEIVEVSAVDGNVLTVERAVEDTQAGSYGVGTTGENRLTAGMWNELNTITDDERTKWNNKQDALPTEQKRNIFISDIEPSNPSENDIWIEVDGDG